jgi:zinc protease
MNRTWKAVVLLIACSLPGQVFATPKIQHWQLKNGARVYFVESHTLPMVQVTAAFDAGSARDPQNKFGLALMTNHLLKEGAAGMNTDEIARGMEDVGAELNSDVHRDMATIGIRTLSDKDKLDASTTLLSQLIAQPAFPVSSLDRERSRLMVVLQSKKQSPGAIASDMFFKLTYGDHPYAHPLQGNAKSIAGIAQKDLIDFHKRYYVGRNAVLAIMGDLDKSQARALSQKILGELPAGQAAPKLPAIEPARKGITEEEQFDSEQSHILVGQVGMRRKDPDYFKLYLGNYILGGGGLVSRLSEVVREKNGLAYSVYSYFWPMQQNGPFIMGLQTANKHRQRALKLIDQVLRDFIKNGPTREELAAAKSHIEGGFALRIDTSRKITDYLAVIGFYRLPLNYLDEFPKKIEAISARQIQRAFERRIHPKDMITVVVGGK